MEDRSDPDVFTCTVYHCLPPRLLCTIVLLVVLSSLRERPQRTHIRSHSQRPRRTTIAILVLFWRETVSSRKHGLALVFSESPSFVFSHWEGGIMETRAFLLRCCWPWFAWQDFTFISPWTKASNMFIFGRVYIWHEDTHIGQKKRNVLKIIGM